MRRRIRTTAQEMYLCCDFCNAASIRRSAIRLFLGHSIFVIWTDCVVMVHSCTHRRKPEPRRDRRLCCCAKPFVLTMQKSLRCQNVSRKTKLHPHTWIQRPECQKWENTHRRGLRKTCDLFFFFWEQNPSKETVKTDARIQKENSGCGRAEEKKERERRLKGFVSFREHPL